MRITVERPDEEEVHLLVRRYGDPLVREFQHDLRERDEIQDYPSCKGGARIAVKKGRGVVMIRGKGGASFGLPGGRIWSNESVEEGALRETEEETGLTVELRGFPEMHKCQYIFKNWNLERWIFVFTGVAVSGSLEAKDTEEVEEVVILEVPPKEYPEDHWLHEVWDKCLAL